MQRLLFAMALLAAPLAKASAQSWTFFGCSSFSCHTATFSKTAINPPTVYGTTPYSYNLSISWTHDFGTNGGFFPYLGAYSYPMPTSSTNDLNMLWDQFGWNSANSCSIFACFGTVRDGKYGLARDDWTISGTSVSLYNNKTAEYEYPYGPQYPILWDPGPLTVVQMNLVPEPGTYALLSAGLAVLLVAARRRVTLPRA